MLNKHWYVDKDKTVVFNVTVAAIIIEMKAQSELAHKLLNC